MLQDATPNSNNRTAIGVIDRRQNIYWVKAHTLLGLRQQLRQLSDIRRDPSRLIAREQLGCQAVTFVGRKRQKKPQQVSAGASFWVAKGDQIPNADTTLDSLYEDSVAQRGQKVRPIQVNHSALITRGRPALGSTFGSLAMFAAILRASSRIRASHPPGQIASKKSSGRCLTRPKTLGRYHRPLRRVYRGSGRRQSSD
jgi:hypothetical protein